MIKRRVKSGFTLIELLVVIAVLAVLMGITIVGIDPVDKINASNDTKVQRDIGAIATAMEAYAVTHNGDYAADQATLIGTGDLKVEVSAPSNYDAYEITTTGGAGVVMTAQVTGELKSKKYTQAATPLTNWVWCSESGRAAATGGGCPGVAAAATPTPP